MRPVCPECSSLNIRYLRTDELTTDLDLRHTTEGQDLYSSDDFERMEVSHEEVICNDCGYSEQHGDLIQEIEEYFGL